MKVIFLGSDSKYRYRECINLAKGDWKNNLQFEFVMSKDFSKYEISKDFIHHFLTIKGVIKYNYSSNIIYRVFEKFFKNFSLWQLVKTIIRYIYLRKIYLVSKKKCLQIKPDFIFTIGDRQQGIIHPFLKAANDLNIKIIHPYIVSEAITWSKRINNQRYLLNKTSSLFEKKIFNKFIEHSFNKKDKKIFFYQAHDMYAYYLFGSLGKYSWWSGNTFGDIVCVDSIITKNYYEEYGKVNKDKINILGDRKYENLIKNNKIKSKIKNKIFKKYKLSTEKKIIIAGLPQYYEEGDYEISWKDHVKELDFLLTNMISQDANILISLHPKMDKNVYSKLIKNYDCHIINEDLDEIICISDLYIATNSSTISWAILLGIKTITMCFYGLDDTYHKNFVSGKIAYNHKEFIKCLNNIFEEENNYDLDWVKLSKDKVFNMGLTERYIDLLKKHL